MRVGYIKRRSKTNTFGVFVSTCGRLISYRNYDVHGDEEPRKVHTIGVRVDTDLLKLLRLRPTVGESVANYVRVSAKCE